MARKKKTKKRKYKRRKRSSPSIQLKKQTVHTVGAIWLWIIAGTIMLSFFGEGTLLAIIRRELSYQIGWIMYALPPFFVSLSFLLFKSKSPLAKPHVPSGFALLLVAFAGLTRAGRLGGFLWNTVATVIAVEGAILLYLGVMVIGLIVVFNTSLDRMIDFILTGIQVLADIVKNNILAARNRGPKPLFSKNDRELKINKPHDDSVVEKQPITPPPVSEKGKATKESSLTIKRPDGSVGDTAMWEPPPVSLLANDPGKKADRGDMRKNASIIEQTLDGFGIQAKVAEVNTGPAVTQYALEIALGTKVSKITSLSSDLALALAAPTGQVRIEAPIPGRSLVGIEIPNRGLEFVTLKRMLTAPSMTKSKSKLSVALGLDVSGKPVIADIAKMPHVLVAGATGSGKSVLVNAWITSILFRASPQEVRFIMVDPKRVELTGYNGIPHLLTPVIVETDKILSSLRWSIKEMEDRYKQFAEVGVRNIEGYNELAGFQSMPYIVIVIDELADLMAYSPVEVEDAIIRLAQMARATGIHLVLATQRPSVDVLTGLIKANVPTRISFNVTSMVDSRVIIDMPGAEKLLGRGDMLFIPPNQAKPSRIQGTFVSEKEVKSVVDHMKAQTPQVEYTEEVLTQPVAATGKAKGGTGSTDGRDQLFEDALRLVCQHDKASASLLQRRLSVGYARAARILDQLEDAGVISPPEGSKPRDVLIQNADDFLALQAQAAEQAQ